jgi:hypothetical protein
MKPEVLQSFLYSMWCCRIFYLLSYVLRRISEMLRQLAPTRICHRHVLGRLLDAAVHENHCKSPVVDFQDRTRAVQKSHMLIAGRRKAASVWR